MTLEKIAFRMFVRTDGVAEYKKRHDEIWPELSQLLREAGVSDYSIYLDEQHQANGYHALFATLRRTPSHTMDALPQSPIMQRWWAHMQDLMRYNADGTPAVESLPCMFHMD